MKYLYVQDIIKSKRSRSVASSDRDEPGRHGRVTLASHRWEFLKSLVGRSSENAMTFRADRGEQVDESGNDSDDGQHG